MEIVEVDHMNERLFEAGGGLVFYHDCVPVPAVEALEDVVGTKISDRDWRDQALVIDR